MATNDELEIWGTFFNNPKFDDPGKADLHFKTFPEATVIFDDLYEKGLGFRNERSYEKKRSGKYRIFDVRKVLKSREK